MLYGLLLTLFIFLCFILILLVLIQKGKSSMGLGGLGGGSQMLFGGSGGQDFFQKLTWSLLTLFMGGSLVLAKLKKPGQAKYLKTMEQQAEAAAAAAVPQQAPATPQQAPAPTAQK